MGSDYYHGYAAMQDNDIYGGVNITWTPSAGTTVSATLNGDPFTSGSQVSGSGIYTLIVITTKISNGRTATQTIHFTIPSW